MSQFFCIVILLFALGCDFPRIILVDDPLTPEEHINLGVAYEGKGKFDYALKEYERASENIPLAYLYIGNIYFYKKDFENAEKYYKTAIKENPDNADAYNNLAWLYYTKGVNIEKAEKLALKALELNPSRKHTYTDTLKKIRKIKNEK